MIKNISKMELLAPAGSPDSLKAAIASGADAVYLGLEQFNARTSAVNFNKTNLRENIEFCHIHGAKVYLTLNTILYDDEIQTGDYGNFSGTYVDITRTDYLGGKKRDYLKKP